jgi:hypothetical protein
VLRKRGLEKRGLVSGLSYQFDMMNERGDRDCMFIAQCYGDEHAIVLARALFDSAFVRVKRIVVWRGDVVVHEAAKIAAYN